MNSLGVTVLLCCGLIAFGACRPSDTEESEDVLRESKREKHYQQSRAEHREAVDDSNIQTLPYYGGGKGKYLIIHPSGKTTVEDHRSEGMQADDDMDNVGQEGDGSENDASEEPPNESVSVSLPADNVSLAEAKPIGLAIAGVGGEASSKPVATAVVGPGGLAIAKPVATAIAGIPGAEGLVGVIGSGKQKQKVTPQTPAKKPATGKARRSIPYYGGRGTMNWPTYPLYKIPESHNWGFILRPVYSNVEYLSY